MNAQRQRLAGDDGATMVEYALMVALIAVVCIAAVTLIGTNANTKFRHGRQLHRLCELSVVPVTGERLHGDDGATMVEYALLVALIAVVCIASIGLLGNDREGQVQHDRQQHRRRPVDGPRRENMQMRSQPKEEAQR